MNIALLSRFEYTIFFDHLTVFLTSPDEILENIQRGTPALYLKNNTYLGFRPSEIDDRKIAAVHVFIERINGTIDDHFNAGLLCFRKQIINMARIEKLLKYIRSVGLEGMAVDHLLWAALFSFFSQHRLGKEYVHVCEKTEIPPTEKPVVIHCPDGHESLFYKYAYEILS